MKRDLDYRLIKDIWAYGTTDQQLVSRPWQRAVGVRRQRLMRRRAASINDVPIQAADRKFLWPQGPRPADAPGLTELGL